MSEDDLELLTLLASTFQVLGWGPRLVFAGNGDGDGTWGFVYARQSLDHPSCVLSPCFYHLLSEYVSEEACTTRITPVFLGWWDCEWFSFSSLLSVTKDIGKHLVYFCEWAKLSGAGHLISWVADDRPSAMPGSVEWRTVSWVFFLGSWLACPWGSREATFWSLWKHSKSFRDHSNQPLLQEAMVWVNFPENLAWSWKTSI